MKSISSKTARMIEIQPNQAIGDEKLKMKLSFRLNKKTTDNSRLETLKNAHQAEISALISENNLCDLRLML